jgi:integrase
LLRANPIAGVKLSKIDVSRSPRFLLADEEARLRRALDDREEQLRRGRDSANAFRAVRRYRLLPDLRARAFADHLKPLVIVALNTGCRRGELFKLTWENVNLTNSRITVQGPTAKSSTTRHIPLNTEAAATLQHWRADLDELQRGAKPGPKTKQPPERNWVFPGKNGARLTHVRRAWESALRSAQITRFRFHDLRHTFASKLVMAGVDLNTVRELMGHSDISMTLRYAHLAPEHKAAAVAKLLMPISSHARSA